MSYKNINSEFPPWGISGGSKNKSQVCSVYRKRRLKEWAIEWLSILAVSSYLPTAMGVGAPSCPWRKRSFQKRTNGMEMKKDTVIHFNKSLKSIPSYSSWLQIVKRRMLLIMEFGYQDPAGEDNHKIAGLLQSSTCEILAT